MSGAPTARALAITGVGVRTALGDLEATARAIERGSGGVGPVRGFDAGGFADPRAAQLPEEPGAEADDPTDRILGFHGRLLSGCAREAHDGAAAATLARERIGFFVAAGMVDSPVEDLAPAVLASRGEDGAFDLSRFFASGFRSIHPLWPLTMLNNVGIGQVATELAVRGENLVVGSEADAGVLAFDEAARAIEDGAADACLVAGVSETVSPVALARESMRWPGGAQPPGEGAGCLLVEPAEAAAARGARPLGFVLATSTAFGPARGGGPTPAAVDRVVKAALAEAGASPDRVALAPPTARAAAGLPRARGSDMAKAIGRLGPATAPVEAALTIGLLAREGRPGDLALVLGVSSSGGVGALLLAGAP